MVYHVYMDIDGLGMTRKEGATMNQQPKQSSIDAETAIFAFEDAFRLVNKAAIQSPKRYLEAYAKAGYSPEGVKETAPINMLFTGFVLGLDYVDYIESVVKGSDE